MKTAPRFSYVICTQPRSGSWLLSEALENTGIAGRPKEYFLDLFEAEWFKRWEVFNYEDYLDRVLEAGTTANGVFGIKIHWVQFEGMIPHLQSIPRFAGLPPKEILSSAFPRLKYVWLKRRDKMRQALSHYKAIMTGRWWQIDGVSPESDPRGNTDFLDCAAVERLEQLAIAQDLGWEEYFAAAGIEPLRIMYEDMVQSFDETIVQLLGNLGIETPPKFAMRQPRLKRQADELTEKWVQEYGAFRACLSQ